MNQNDELPVAWRYKYTFRGQWKYTDQEPSTWKKNVPVDMTLIVEPLYAQRIRDERDALKSRAIDLLSVQRDLVSDGASMKRRYAETKLADERRIKELRDERNRLRAALSIAEAALADIGDADREPGDDLAWCERRAAEALPEVRAALAGEKT